jgi:hypothetical protein
MKWIEDLDFGRFRTQGIVAVGVFIRMLTVSWPQGDVAGPNPMDQFPPADSFCLSRCAGTLKCHGSLLYLAEPRAFALWLRTLFRQDWVIYAKRPFGGPQHALRYLGAYTHRVAISNHRLVALEEGKVTFRWRNSAHGNKEADEPAHSCGASCCICSRAASYVFATSVSSPTAAAPSCCPSASNC